MKKILFTVVSFLTVLGMSATGFASDVDGAVPRGYGKGTPVSGSVETYTRTVAVKGNAHLTQADGMFDLINKIRQEAGLHELIRDPYLEEAAKQRAFEISVSFAHTRPNSTNALKISEYVYGENIAHGIENYYGMNGTYQDRVSDKPTSFMQSEAHRALILEECFTSVQIYCFAANDQLYWVQLYGKTTDADISK